MIEIVLIAGLVIIAAAAITLAGYIHASAKQERQELVRRLVVREQDILDRLMAKGLTEVKYAQREPESGVVTSKRRNDARITQEKAQIG